MSAIQEMTMAQAAAAVSKVYATWDPAFKASNLTLSNGNLTVTPTSTTAGLVRSTIGVTTGKHYWEETIATTVIYVSHGVCNGSEVTSSWIGGTVNSWGYNAWGGTVLNNTFSVAAPGTYAAGDVIGYALDADAHTLKVYKNNTLVATVTGLSALIYACACENGTTIGGPNTVNFGATPFVYGPPSGYNAGLYTVPGQHAYTTPGTFSWTCPSGVGSVSVVAVGAGGSGIYPSGSASGDSYFSSSATVKGGGGSYNATGGTHVGDGGGNGGATDGSNYLGGGGAGGYAGAGGAGSAYGNGGNAGAGGGGGGGGDATGTIDYGDYGGGGGGVGLLGQGTSGAAGGYLTSNNGKGGSSGANGGLAADNVSASGGAYGGGAGGGYGAAFSGSGGGLGYKNNIAVVPGTSYTVVVGAPATATTSPGGGGGVRIIWPGTTRQFPSTNTGDM